MAIQLVADRSIVRPEGRVKLDVKNLNKTRDYVVIFRAGGQGDFRSLAGRPVLSVVDSSGVPVTAIEGKGDSMSILWNATGLAATSVPVEMVVYDRAAITAFTPTAISTLLNSGTPLRSPLTSSVDVTDRRDSVSVRLSRAGADSSPMQALQTAIRTSTDAISWTNYSRFMDSVLCGLPDDPDEARRIREARDKVKPRLRLPFPDTDAYRQLKVATEVFMMLNCGVDFERDAAGDGWFDRLTQEQIDEEGRRYGRRINGSDEIARLWEDLLNGGGTLRGSSPNRTILYLSLIRKKLGASTSAPRTIDRTTNALEILQSEESAVVCEDILLDKLTHPCFLELIWSYWHEEGMLVQSINTIAWRFQNRRAPGVRDSLALLEIDPLRPLNNFIWGYIQDEQHRLTPVRRTYEYDHHYGVTVLGRSMPPVRGADSRTRFIEAFHNLLYLGAIFFKEDDDTTIIADGFPLLNALKEVHLLLTQGAHNQYGDLPWTARQEMLMEEWLLARPEFAEFLPRRTMVDYTEEWMDSVETMKMLQGWSTASILHFRDLGVFGEKILLGIRFAAWPSIIDPLEAANWARYWRSEIQGYTHAYRAATGVDLTERPDPTMPALLLQQRFQAPLVARPRPVIGAGSRRAIPARAVSGWGRENE
jgi:hypothetical protein